MREMKEIKPALLLHSCCGPCSTAVIERLLGRYELTVFFYNPNITDEDEYRRRLEAQRTVINKNLEQGNSVRLIEGEYDPGVFFEYVKGLENEPENGERCTKCFELRMKRTAAEGLRLGYGVFATTLSVSPHKNTERINAAGYAIEAEPEYKDSGLVFLDESFKKKDGFKRSIELSKEYGLYRQNYCGCDFSRRGR